MKRIHEEFRLFAILIACTRAVMCQSGSAIPAFQCDFNKNCTEMRNDGDWAISDQRHQLCIYNWPGAFLWSTSLHSNLSFILDFPDALHVACVRLEIMMEGPGTGDMHVSIVNAATKRHVWYQSVFQEDLATQFSETITDVTGMLLIEASAVNKCITLDRISIEEGQCPLPNSGCNSPNACMDQMPIGWQFDQWKCTRIWRFEFSTYSWVYFGGGLAALSTRTFSYHDTTCMGIIIEIDDPGVIVYIYEGDTGPSNLLQMVYSSQLAPDRQSYLYLQIPQEAHKLWIIADDGLERIHDQPIVSITSIHPDICPVSGRQIHCEFTDDICNMIVHNDSVTPWHLYATQSTNDNVTDTDVIGTCVTVIPVNDTYVHETYIETICKYVNTTYISCMDSNGTIVPYTYVNCTFLNNTVNPHAMPDGSYLYFHGNNTSSSVTAMYELLYQARTICLSFKYLIKDGNPPYLKVRHIHGDGGDTIMEVHQSLGDIWWYAEVQINLTFGDRIELFGSSVGESHMAFDNATITESGCPSVGHYLPYRCDFNMDTCGYLPINPDIKLSQANSDEYNEGHMIAQVEHTPPSTMWRKTFTTVYIKPNLCINFKYQLNENMLDDSVELSLLVNDIKRTNLFHYQGDGWMDMQLQVSDNIDYTFDVQFNVTGHTQQQPVYVGLDDISIYPISCPGFRMPYNCDLMFGWCGMVPINVIRTRRFPNEWNISHGTVSDVSDVWYMVSASQGIVHFPKFDTTTESLCLKLFCYFHTNGTITIEGVRGTLSLLPTNDNAWTLFEVTGYYFAILKLNKAAIDYVTLTEGPCEDSGVFTQTAYPAETATPTTTPLASVTSNSTQFSESSSGSLTSPESNSINYQPSNGSAENTVDRAQLTTKSIITDFITSLTTRSINTSQTTDISTYAPSWVNNQARPPNDAYTLLELCQPMPVITNAVGSRSFSTDGISAMRVKFKCRDGYEMNIEESLGVLSCSYFGIWKGPIISCKEKQCPEFPLSTGTSRDTEDRTKGTVVIYQCLPGRHFLDGSTSRTIVCDQDWKWTNAPPECEEMLCPPLTPGYAKLDSNNRHAGSKVTAKCPEGHRFFTGLSTATLQCTMSGHWNTALSACIPSIDSCPPPPYVSNSTIELISERDHKIAVYRCHEFYKFDDGSIIYESYCNSYDRKWNNVPPKCKETFCKIPTPITRTTMEYISGVTAFLPGDLVIYHCENQTRFSDGSTSKNAYCLSNGSWNIPLDTCECRLNCTSKRFFVQRLHKQRLLLIHKHAH